jgi:hypothetical protein
MGRLISAGGALVVYLSVATVLTTAIVFGYLWTHGYLDGEKLNRIVEVVRGTDVVAPTVDQTVKTPQAGEQPSIEDLEWQRAIKSRQIELREQEVDRDIEGVRFEQRKLSDEKAQYVLLKEGFEKLLAKKENQALQAGEDSMQLIWENIKPPQAKEQILQMIDANEQDEVVSILAKMDISKQARIISQFKTPEESKKLEEILRKIRQGVPDVITIDKAREKLKKFNPQQK